VGREQTRREREREREGALLRNGRGMAINLAIGQVFKMVRERIICLRSNQDEH
jgi:hypothetical protein